MSRLISLLDRPVAYQPCFVQFGGITGAVLLSQLVYWHNRMDGGWFYKTQREINQETGLTRAEQETARRRLISSGVIEEDLRGVPAKLYFRVQSEHLESVLLQNAENKQSSLRKSSKQDCDKSAAKNAGNTPASLRDTNSPASGIPATIHTVDYQETTTEITNKDLCPVSAKPDDELDEFKVLEHLNRAAGLRYQKSRSSLGPIRGRLSEDFTADELILAVDYTIAKWSDDAKMRDYVRPETIFRQGKFPAYLGSAQAWERAGRPPCVKGKWQRDTTQVASMDYQIPDGFKGA